RKQLQEWVASKGKTYKRPPMMLPPKKTVDKKPNSRSCIKEEEEQRLEQLRSDRINTALSNCLKRIEEGGPSKGLLQMLARIPRIERFARFWVCRAKLLARAGPFDATGLYRDAVCAGAVVSTSPAPRLRQLPWGSREADSGSSSTGETSLLSCSREPAEPPGCEAGTPCGSERLHAPETPCLTGSRLPGSSIKLHLLSLPRHGEQPESHGLTLMTPVRRSQRVERSAGCYPRMLKDHDPVVSSLDEILRREEGSELLFRKNEALP
ncbi:CKP2L protein, partial [Crypturellus soui]|nr:CKP2L protein [Crypturellus soui]